MFSNGTRSLKERFGAFCKVEGQKVIMLDENVRFVLSGYEGNGL